MIDRPPPRGNSSHAMPNGDRVTQRSDNMVSLKTTLEARQAVHMKKMQLILDSAEREARALTESERADLKAIEAELNTIETRLEKLATEGQIAAEITRLTAGMTGPGGGASGGRRLTGSLGAQFVNSDVMKWLQDHRNSRAGAWNSPSVELFATTLDESSGSGGALVLPDVRPGIVELPQRPLVVADLMAQGSTTSNSVTFLAETAFTNAAAAVAEGGQKPESVLVFEQTSEPVRKFAHLLPVTDELFSDVAQMQSYIDGRLRLGVQLVEDDELLNGSGSTPHLLGLMNRSGMAPTIARGSDTNGDAVARQIQAISVGTNLAADAVIMHPSNYLTIRLQKNANGDYLFAGGPFGSWGAPQLWGLPCALTTAMTLGTCLVGAFKTAVQIFRNGQLRVDISNSHSDFFVKNLIAIRAEERMALVTYRASAIGKVTGLN